MHTDVLIVGSGLAGLYTALSLDEKFNITIITKDKVSVNNSSLAQGGIAVSLDETYFESHINDTMTAGCNINNFSAVELIVKKSNANIQKLIDFGVKFDKDNNGNLLLIKEGGHSQNRVLHCDGDATGKEIIGSLVNEVRSRSNIDILEDAMMTDLIINDNVCHGIEYLNKEENKCFITSSYVIIATGGIGLVYNLSTNVRTSSGDGIAACQRAGVQLENLEFVQFHPTTLYQSSKSGQTRLISEAVRGEGAKLYNVEHERFMTKYDSRLELATRDIVSRSIFKEMYNTWTDYVYLDCKEIDMKNRFPNISKILDEYNINPSVEEIKVSPSEHYMVGGVKTDLQGKTSVKRLFAVGECASTGLHGANRLANNSLLECIVFGNEVASEINKTFDTHEYQHEISKISKMNFKYNGIISEVNQLMGRYCGIVRTKDELLLTSKILKKHLYNLSKHTNGTKKYYETYNIVTVAHLIIVAALNRKQSVGCHYIIKEK